MFMRLLWNFRFIWLRSGLQVNPCTRNQPTYILVCLPEVALILGGEGLSLKQKHRSYCYPGYNVSPYSNCFVLEMRFWPGRVYDEPNLSSYSPRSLEHITGREQNLMVTKQLGGEALLVESSALALHQTSTEVYRKQASSLFSTEQSIYACGKELSGFIFCCNWRKRGYRDIHSAVYMIGILAKLEKRLHVSSSFWK